MSQQPTSSAHLHAHLAGDARHAHTIEGRSQGALAVALGLEVIAEGIEHAGQATLLATLGCDQLQGYHFGRPEPLAALAARLAGAAAAIA